MSTQTMFCGLNYTKICLDMIDDLSNSLCDVLISPVKQIGIVKNPANNGGHSSFHRQSNPANKQTMV